MKTELIRQLKGDEGVKPCAYQDHLGFWTIGVGRLIDARKPGAGLRPDEIYYLLANDVEVRTNDLQRELPWFYMLDDVRKGVLIAMAFQLGTAGLLGFKNTLALVKDGKYAEAADNMLLSKWAEQTPARAQRLAKQMTSGEWQFAEGA